jgi:hypothetical protein
MKAFSITATLQQGTTTMSHQLFHREGLAGATQANVI